MPPIENLEFNDAETKQFEAMMSGTEPPPDTPTEPPKEEAPPADPPKTEAAPPAEPPKQEPEKPVRLVPHQALHEERERRKQLEQRIAQLEKAQPQPAGDEPPDEATDPIGSIAWLKARLAAKEKAEQDAREQNAYMQDLGRKVAARVDAYAAEHPEYQDQVKFLRDFRFRELTEGLGYPPQMAAVQVQQEEIALGKQAIDNDLDPGAMVAKLATVRGWKAKEAPKQQEVKANAKPTPSDDEKKLDRLARGHKAAVSPSNAGGGGPDPEMTLEAIANLEGAAWDKVWESGKVKKLMGG